MKTAARPAVDAPCDSIAWPHGVQIVRAATELDCGTAAGLVARVEDVVRTTRDVRIEIDLEAVEFIDAAGLRALAECTLVARRAGRQLAHTNPSRSVRRLVSLFPEVSSLIDVTERD